MHSRLFLFAALALSVRAQSVRSELLVSTDWLADHLNDPKVAVLHAGRERAGYDAAHIPGARFLAWGELTETADGVPNELPPVSKLIALFERLGVSDGTRVVLYGDMPILAARGFYTLDYIGHGGHAALLDGGLEKWRAENRPLSKEEPQVSAGRLSPRLDPEILVSLDSMRDLSYVAAQAPGSNVVLLDARPPADYSGAKPAGGDPPRFGHIPGAQNLYWMDALAGKENPVLRPVSELRQLFERAGAGPGRKIVTYCNSGVQASYAYFLARYLGYDAAMYDGSLSEWTKASGELKK